MAEQHLGVAQHREHLDRGDRQAHHPAGGAGRHLDLGTKEARHLLGGLNTEAAGQGLIAEHRQGDPGQVGQ